VLTCGLGRRVLGYSPLKGYVGGQRYAAQGSIALPRGKVVRLIVVSVDVWRGHVSAGRCGM
jgi:hypothetical protein